MKLERIFLPSFVSTDSGWNWTPYVGYRTCRSPMTVSSAVHAVTTSASGMDALSTISEWYRVASNGSFTPARTPELSWRIQDVLPWDGTLRTTLPPKASPRH